MRLGPVRRASNDAAVREARPQGAGRWYPAAVFALSLIVTLGFWHFAPFGAMRNESSDYAHFYEPVARQILAGHGVVRPDGSPAARYPPGFPALLAGAFAVAAFLRVPETVALGGLNAVGLAISSVLLYAIAKRVWHPRAALLAAAAWMTYPLSLWFTKQPNSEIPFLVFVYGAYLFLANALWREQGRQGFAFAGGVLAGGAMLIRPIGVGLGLLMAAAILFTLRGRERPGRWRAAGLVLLGNLIVVMPWEIWLSAQTGKLVPLSTGGVMSVRDGLTFAQQTQDLPADVAALARDIRTRYKDLRTLPAIGNLLMEEIQARPAAVMKLLAIKAVRSWYGTESRRREPVILAIQACYLVLIVCCAAAAVRRGGRPRQLAFLVGATGLYFWGMAFLTLSIVRYLVPAVGLLFLVLPVLVPRSESRPVPIGDSSGPVPVTGPGLKDRAPGGRGLEFARPSGFE